MASSRLPLLLPLLLVLALSLAPSLSTHGSALARSISASDVSDGDIDSYLRGSASNEGDSAAVAVPGAEEQHEGRKLQQQVACGKDSIRFTNRLVSDAMNGSATLGQGSEEHVRRSLQRQQVSCDQNSLLITNRIVSDQGNGTKAYILELPNGYDFCSRQH
ncbi:unnamed protein product [Closterium sp. Naga37s-1]|nr:unnamed protein product [Closterium sp. Naga37s-1]